MAQIVIIADDLTGAADCAVACASNGLEAVVLLGRPEAAKDLHSADVLAIDADTRSMAPAHAAEKVAELIHCVHGAGAMSGETLLFKKLDSTLRGHVGEEIAVALETVRSLSLPQEHVVGLLAPASPAHGRTTVRGRQLVQGQPLEDACLWPGERIRPRSNLVDIVGAAGPTCGRLEIAQVREGTRALENELIRLARDADVLVCDAETDEDLRAIARASMALRGRCVWAGAAGLAAHLPEAAGLRQSVTSSARYAVAPLLAQGPTLFVVGSRAIVSRAQARVLTAQTGVAAVFVGADTLLAGEQLAVWHETAVGIREALRRGEDALVMIDETGTGGAEQERILAHSLGRIIEPCASLAGALVVTGGETARAILDAWGIDRLRILGEVEPGLPYSVPEGWARRIPILTKAGGFGTSRTLVHCLEFVRRLSCERDRGQSKPGSSTRMIADKHKPIIAITMGDAAGIGPEIIVKSLARAEVHEQCRPLVIGDAQRLAQAAQIAGVQLDVRGLSIDEIDLARYECGTIDCIDLKLIPPDLPWGRLSPQAGEAAYRYLEVAARLALAGKVAAICTAPLNKEALQAAGHKFPGHTELLAHLTHTPEVSMMLTTPKMKVIHVTTHIGLIDAIARIEPGLVDRTIARGHAALEKAGIANPRIGVCGINPHAGENGLFGYGEEEQKIVPAIALCRERGWNVEGPLPADTLFFRAQRGDFDLVVAMYHDQGHGPVKVLGLESGVNITVGLPVVRTSVDHGTAFDIAGTGKADERSLLEAIRQAVQLAPKPDAAGHFAATEAP